MSAVGVTFAGQAKAFGAALRRLLSAKDAMPLSSLRTSFVRYLLAFPLAMVFANTQNIFNRPGILVLGVSSATITILAFFIGTISIFAFARIENIAAISKISGSLALLGLAPWVLLPPGLVSLWCAVVMMFGVGGCLAVGTFSFVFVLNNAERFVGSAAMVLLIGWLRLFRPVFENQVASRVAVPTLVISLSICMFRARASDYQVQEIRGKSDPSLWLVLLILLSYFAIRLTGFYAPAAGRGLFTDWFGVAAWIIILVYIIFQMAVQRSIWVMCCVFYLSSILSYVGWYSGSVAVAGLFSEMKEIGMLVSFYLLGCVQNKFCNFRTHKLLVVYCMAVLVLLFLGVEVVHYHYGSTQTVALVTAAGLFVIFLLLSPAFSKYLFFADWSKELRSTNMRSGAEPVGRQDSGGKRMSLGDFPLSPRERQVVQALLRGLTLKQVARELGLTASTVATYSRAIYKKLEINSRAELFLLFSEIHLEDPGSSSN